MAEYEDYRSLEEVGIRSEPNQEALADEGCKQR